MGCFVFSLDQEQKEELVHVIEKLLSEKTTLVVGSAVMAFEEVCYSHHIYIISAYKYVHIR
jgi:ABC-type histidine transport system ATPase subunit